MTYKELQERKEKLERELESVQEELENMESAELREKYVGKWFRESRPKPFSDTTYIYIKEAYSTNDDHVYGEGKGILINNNEEILFYNGDIDLENCVEISKEEVLKNLTEMINNWISKAEGYVQSTFKQDGLYHKS